jgi:hypothetical protein
MVTRLEIRGLKEGTRIIAGIGRRTKEEPTMLTHSLAKMLRERIKANVPRSNSPLSSGHSTPTKLLHRLNPVRTVKHGHVVRFKDVAEDRYYDLPTILDEGAREHPISIRNRPIMSGISKGRRFFARQVQHPGIKPTFFWRDAVSAFLINDFEGTVDKSVLKIVG